MILAKIKEAFGHIEFFEKDHKYINTKTNKKLVSTTTKKKELTDPFPDYMLGYKAKQLGIPKFKLKRDWDLKRIIGSERGSLIHYYLEVKFTRKTIEQDIPYYIPMYDVLLKQANQYYEDWKHEVTIGSEIVIGDDLYGGQIDRLSYHGGKYYINDYKCDKKFSREGYKGKMLKAPFDFLPAANYGEYIIQTNMYRFLFTKYTGIEIAGIRIIWFCTTNETYEIIDIPLLDLDLFEKWLY